MQSQLVESLKESLTIAADQNQRSREKRNEPDESAHPYSPLNLDVVEKILGYSFNEKRLLEEAFTHASYSEKCVSYERLEYIGDSVLNLLIATEHFFLYPDSTPGLLTRLRAANVDTEKLARVAIKHGLHHCLRHKKPLLQQQIKEFEKAIEEYPLHSNGLIKVPKALADIVESTIGAVYIDCRSTDTVWEVFKRLLEPMIDLETLKTHPVTELHEICQKRKLNLRFKDSWGESKEIVVYIGDELVGTGSHCLKKEIAHNRAAKDALDNLRRILEENGSGSPKE